MMLRLLLTRLSLSGSDEDECDCWNPTHQRWWLHSAGPLMNTHEAAFGLHIHLETAQVPLAARRGSAVGSIRWGVPQSPFTHLTVNCMDIISESGGKEVPWFVKNSRSSNSPVGPRCWSWAEMTTDRCASFYWRLVSWEKKKDDSISHWYSRWYITIIYTSSSV